MCSRHPGGTHALNRRTHFRNPRMSKRAAGWTERDTSISEAEPADISHTYQPTYRSIPWATRMPLGVAVRTVLDVSIRWTTQRATLQGRSRSQVLMKPQHPSTPLVMTSFRMACATFFKLSRRRGGQRPETSAARHSRCNDAGRPRADDGRQPTGDVRRPAADGPRAATDDRRMTTDG